MNEALDNLDRLLDEVSRCCCPTCEEERQARLSRDLEIKFGCDTEFMLQRKRGTN